MTQLSACTVRKKIIFPLEKVKVRKLQNAWTSQCWAQKDKLRMSDLSNKPQGVHFVSTPEGDKYKRYCKEHNWMV